MNPVTNPFAPGAGNKPPELAGRENILDEARTALARIIAGRSSQSQILLGLRGTGKTVLLNEIRNYAEKLDYMAALFEAPEDHSLANMLYPEMQQALRTFSNVEAAKSYALKGLGALQNFASIFKVKVSEVEFEVKPTAGTADSGFLERDLTEMFEMVGRAAQAANRGWALLIDEVQYLQEDELTAVITAVHRVNQRGLPIIVFAAGLPQIARLAGDAKSYAERLFSYPKVGALSPEDAEAAIRNPLKKEGVEIEDDALSMIVEKTEGYPYFIQTWGKWTWNTAEVSPITLQDVKDASEIAIDRLDNEFFKVRMDRLTPAEVSYVHAMAALGSGPYSAAKVAEQLKRKPKNVSPLRDSVIKKGMIFAPARGEIEFTVPMYDEHLRRQEGLS